jgi:perosamine synthetase
VFVDVKLATFTIDSDAACRATGARTRAILPVSLFGLSADMAPLLALAGGHALHLIEDDACALGACYHGKHAGTSADLGCFSFHPRKAITTGEGGMIVTDREDLATRLRSLRDHGASVSDLARHHARRSYELPAFDVLGFNYRMTDFQGAVGVAQMQKLPWILEQRRRVAHAYDSGLSEVGWLRSPAIPATYTHGYQSYVCLFAPEPPTLDNVESLHSRRNAVMDTLEQAGISTRPGTHAVHMLGYYRSKYHFTPSDFPNAYLADRLSLALPLFAQMTPVEQEYVLDTLRQIAP